MFLFWHQLLVYFVPHPLEGQQTAPFRGERVCCVKLQYTSLCLCFCFMFRADLGGRDSLGWRAQMDSRSDLKTIHPPLNHYRLNWTFSTWLPSMRMYHLNMCKLDVNSQLPRGNRPPSTFRLIWTKNERHEYVCEMIIGCFAAGRNRHNWRGWKAWRQGKGFSLSFCWFCVWCSLCVCFVGAAKLSSPLRKKFKFNTTMTSKRQLRQHVYSPSGTAWFYRACWRDRHCWRKGWHCVNFSTHCCHPMFILNC